MDRETEPVAQEKTVPSSRDPGLLLRRIFSSRQGGIRFGAADRLLPRWIFLRALGLIYFSAFFALLFQIKGLIGPHGILSAGQYLTLISDAAPGAIRYWYAPTLLWLASGSHMLMALYWVGLLASVLLVANVWPRLMLGLCFVCFLSFVAAAGEFSGYQSDGMLLEAGYICLFFAPPGVRPGLGEANPPSRFSLFLLQWEWFRIYLQSGIVKLASGDPQWRNFTAMDEYYQNCPLPTWVGWYVQHLPHWFHAGTVVATLVMELVLVWMILLSRRFRRVLFVIVTVWEAGVILTANYAFLNYLVLALGILLVDDRFVMRWTPAALRPWITPRDLAELPASENGWRERVSRQLGAMKLAVTVVVLGWIFYATTAKLVWMVARRAPLPMAPVQALEPFRVANQYGLFAVMTRGRYEVEFQGSADGVNWVAYPFRYKPQALDARPRIYAPYQPRFDWNLWFASLGTWRDSAIVPSTELLLLANDPDVLALFAANPFAKAPPRQVRAVLWQYWMTSMSEKRQTGNWWRRELVGPYAPTLEKLPDGRVAVISMPAVTEPKQ